MAIFNSYVGLPEGIFPLEGFNLFQENVDKNQHPSSRMKTFEVVVITHSNRELGTVFDIQKTSEIEPDRNNV